MSKKKSMQELFDSSMLAGGNIEFLEQMYDQYLENPNSVPEYWQNYFSVNLHSDNNDKSHKAVIDFFEDYSKNKQNYIATQVSSGDALNAQNQGKVDKLVDSFRRFGHKIAKTDPIAMQKMEFTPQLTKEFWELTQTDSNKKYLSEGFYNHQEELNKVIADLEKTYCGSIGYEYWNIDSSEERNWLREKIESRKGNLDYSDELKKIIYEKLVAADGLEKYLHTKYVGQKRFSLEGGESFIPMLDTIIHHYSQNGGKEIIIGMAHRGRLNVLVNVLGKSPQELFDEFEGKALVENISGDVKYHQGFSSLIKTSTDTVHVALAFNPSHLEIVTPVTQGSAKAKQYMHADKNKDWIMDIAVHGDAAVAGQGCVMESLSMSQIKGYGIGGTIHIVINNQVGFTANPNETRSTRYCTDIFKMLDVPVFHVNGDDPEAVVFATKLAVEYKIKFKKDVAIDLVCYRRHGHNQADEPSATQPVMYSHIKKMPSVKDLYANRLISEKIISSDDAANISEHYRAKLDKGEMVAANLAEFDKEKYHSRWGQFRGKELDIDYQSKVELNRLQELGQKINTMPEGLKLQLQVKKIYENRLKMIAGEVPLDWGTAENLAYATLLDSDYSIRISGQDSQRGTFAHRHAVVYDQNTGEGYCPLEELSKNKQVATDGWVDKLESPSNIKVLNSLLSEEAVLAFEYGYAATDPNTLVIWEAQFGDFANGAQVVVDQFISSGEQKWNRLSSITMLLPHGYEGMGPEHTSARLERYLQLCAEQNMQVCMPTTPAQVYHLIRRQLIRDCRKPLIVLTPKSLLRHKQAVSSLEELASGKFELLLSDPALTDSKKYKDITRVVLCTGKVYYELAQIKEQNKVKNVAIIRLEQLYPFPKIELCEELAKFKNAKEVIWCQEEPMNQGSWYCIQHNIRACLPPKHELQYVGREPSSSPANGRHKIHVQEQNILVEKAILG